MSPTKRNNNVASLRDLVDFFRVLEGEYSELELADVWSGSLMAEFQRVLRAESRSLVSKTPELKIKKELISLCSWQICVAKAQISGEAAKARTNIVSASYSSRVRRWSLRAPPQKNRQFRKLSMSEVTATFTLLKCWFQQQILKLSFV